MVVTPEKAVLDTSAEMVVVPMFDGELGVLPGRQPLIGRLGFGELRTIQGKTTQRYFIDGGFVQVRGDVVTLLTARAVPAEELNAAAAQAALQEALRPVPTAAEEGERFKAQQRARAQLRILNRLGRLGDVAPPGH
ncbi:MAG: ATP synthase F1 subunit epsilon [Gemmataceae bacterium]|nr:ATP synthase F1 subunit epsilon [Gemmataceae bacterium]